MHPVNKEWKKANRAVAYAPIPDRTLLIFVTDEDYRSAYFKAEKSEGKGDNHNVPFVGGQWHHVCMAFEAAKGTVDIVLDGQLLERAYFGDNVASIIRTDFNIMLRPLISEYTDVNMWDVKLDQSQMLDWTNCKHVLTLDGNLVSWSQSVWVENGVTAKEEPLEKVCQKSDTLDAILPRKFNMTGCTITCGNYGGTPTPIDSKEMQYMMYQDEYFNEISYDSVNGNLCKLS